MIKEHYSRMVNLSNGAKYIPPDPNRKPFDWVKEGQRPSWDVYFMGLCDVVATRSTCIRRQVGAIIVKDNRILATGYNGAPSGLTHCEDMGCYRQAHNIPSGTLAEKCRAAHAEQNAIVQAAKYGISINYGVLYCTNFPCSICAKLIINAGIIQVIHKEDYNDDLSKELFEESDIEVVQF
jgi:dCMP deaminase